MSPEFYAARDLIAFSTSLLERAGLPTDRANVVAEILLDADLMGHTTHGLQLLAPYLRELETGTMLKDGDPTVIQDRGSAITWDGRYLPGPWLVTQALNVAFERIHDHPVVTVAIQRSHHIACLAAYPKRATDKGLMMLLATSDPHAKSVAPYSGLDPLYSPNPLAAGIPTQGEPIILDISMSTTAMGLAARLLQEGDQLPYPWLLDNQGNPSNDPADLVSEPPGSIQPLGGSDLGYKGFALGILIEALTSSLAGFGRSDQPSNWGASVFLQVIDPDAFGGRSHFLQETEWLAEASRSSRTKPNAPPVRLPGSRALQLRAQHLQGGVELYPSILPSLREWAEKYNLSLPQPISSEG